MSALLQSQLSQPARYPLAEAASLRAISGLALTAEDLDSGLEGLAETALRVPGLHKIQITPTVLLPPLERLEWYASTAPVLCGSATAFVEANGRSWGRLQLYFEPRIQTVESPLRFARFLGQQVALLLNRFMLEAQRDTQLATLDRLRRRLDMRIAVHRATGILAELRGVTDKEALALLVRYARESRRTLASLADAIILGDTSFRKPFFRPLQRSESAARARLFA
ncbi:MAG TPA: ANTAR domain-containing protein [Bryobacteraceae bacterium]|nr:ANTAR domain-containing protein [Bryobacteraceae bacterium]